MSDSKLGIGGITTREVDLSAPLTSQPSGVPAAIIGNSVKGVAFCPITVGNFKDYTAKFGATDGKKFGMLAVNEWLRRASAVTYVKVLGAGNGQARLGTADANAGRVANSGFVVGDQQRNSLGFSGQGGTGAIAANPFANGNGAPGRTYILGCLMSESFGTTTFSETSLRNAGVVTSSLPIVRGIIFAASGVLLRLSSSVGGNSSAPSATAIGTDVNSNGSPYGHVVLNAGGVAKQQFTLLLNGHQGTNPTFPNVLTCSFDMTAVNYFGNILNRNPLLMQNAGHYLYSSWDIHPAAAVVTGTGMIAVTSGAGATANVNAANMEPIAFLLTGTNAWNVGTSTAPNFENFQNRYSTPRSPWIISQRFGGVPINLFRIWALDDGAYSSGKIKISIENIAPSTDLTNQYGSFDLLVRDIADTDQAPRILERFRGINLDPSSDRFIGKIIGDQYLYFDFDRPLGSQKIIVAGNYPNISSYIRVELPDAVLNSTTPPTAMPMGFRGHQHLVTSGTQPLTSNTSSATTYVVADLAKYVNEQGVPMRASIADGAGGTVKENPAYYWGVRFEHVTNPLVPNGSTMHNKSFENGFGIYYPDFQTSNMNFVVADNNGVADTAANGILDADRYGNNLFTLENIQVVTASTTLADPSKWANAIYVRSSSIASSDATKTRALMINDLVTPNRRFAKFSLFLQGGFDGINIFDEDQTNFTNQAVTEEINNASRGGANGPCLNSYLKAIDILKNTADVDIQLLAIPGIRNSAVTDYALAAMDERFDALYIMDIEEYDNLNVLVTSSLQTPSVSNTVTNFKNRGVNSSFGAAYYPDVIVKDPTTLTNLVVPPSVVVLGAFALNDAVGFPWFAPAGFTRGALPSTIDVKVKLSKTNMDNLYDTNINPISAFPGSSPGTPAAPNGGPVVWGQKTLFQTQGALDRVNVRRLLIECRRQARDAGNAILFEPNRAATLTKFSNALKPRLAKIQAQAGLQNFVVQIDTTTTTQADIENNMIRGKIFVQPTKTIEYVALDFIVGPPGKDPSTL